MYVVCVKAEEVGGEGPGQLTPEGGLLVETRESCVGRVVVVLDGNKAGKWSSCLIHISGVCVCVCVQGYSSDIPILDGNIGNKSHV